MIELDSAWNAGWNVADDPCNIPTSYPTITCDETNPIDKRITSMLVTKIFFLGQNINHFYLITSDVSNQGLVGIVPPSIGQLPFLEYL